MPNFLLTTFSGLPKTVTFFTLDPGIIAIANVLDNLHQDYSILDFNSDETLNYLSEKKNFYSNINDIKEKKSILINLLKNYILKSIKKTIHSKNIQILAVKVWLGESLTIFNYIFSEIKKDNPNLFIIVGGSAINMIGPDIRPFIKNVDAISIGDGEVVFEALSKHFEKTDNWRSKIPNTIFLSSTESLFFSKYYYDGVINYKNILTNKYLDFNSKLKFLVLDDSRGCSFGCPFCPHNIKGDEKKIDKLLEEIKLLNNTYKLSIFRLAGSSPTSSFLNNFAQGLADLNLNLGFASFLNPLIVSKVNLALLKKAGFKSFLLGMESLSNSIFDKKSSGYRAQGSNYFKDLFANDIYPVFSFIFSNDYLEETLIRQFILNNFNDNNLSIFLNFPTFYPNTPWFDRPAEYGIEIIDKHKYLETLILKSDRMNYFKIREIDSRHLILNFQNLIKCLSEVTDINVNDDVALISKFTKIKPIVLNRLQQGLIANHNFQDFIRFKNDLNRFL